MDLILNDEIQKSFSDQSQLFDQIMAITGTTYRAIARRKTLCFTKGSKSYFIKKHFGVGWREIFKNLLLGRLPIIGAKNELTALTYLQHLGINTLSIAGYGTRGSNPARMESFIITDALIHTKTIRDILTEWETTPPTFLLKKYLITTLAQMISCMHRGGLNHRDCYLLHFRIDSDICTQMPAIDFPIYVIDLHRAQIRPKTPKRWLIKDLAGIHFSSKNGAHITKHDLFRFMKVYTGKPLKQILKEETAFWLTVKRKGEKLYKKYLNKP